MNENSPILILQDCEDKNLFYVAVRKENDNEDEKTIIGYGESREDALISSLISALRSQEKCLEAIRTIGNLISHSDFCDMRDDLCLASREVPVPNEKGCTFSAVGYDEEERIWLRFMR